MRTLMWLNYATTSSTFYSPLLPAYFTICTFPTLSQVSVLLLHFLRPCVTAQRSCCVASSVSSSFPWRDGHWGKQRPRNPTFIFQDCRKTAQLPTGEHHWTCLTFSRNRIKCRVLAFDKDRCSWMTLATMSLFHNLLMGVSAFCCSLTVFCHREPCGT